MKKPGADNGAADMHYTASMPATRADESHSSCWAAGGSILAGLALLSCPTDHARAGTLGVFGNQSDVGAVGLAGLSVFQASDDSYHVTGGGENMWSTNDAFHFVWTRVSGDFSFEAGLEWVNAGGNAHRKACLMVRQSLTPDSPYVDVAVHGDGLTSLQFRAAAGAVTHEVQANFTKPARVGIERHAGVFWMTAPAPGEASGGRLQPAGGFTRLEFTDPVYVGLAVCAHDNKVSEQARFVGVSLKTNDSLPKAGKPVLHCALETINVASKDRRAIYHTRDHIEAPNWSRDGRFLLFNSEGKIFRLPAAGGVPEPIDTGFANRCNNDHGLSPDGARLAISDQSRDGGSRIYVLPAAGGEPRLVTPLAPSYWHGWSPDGSTLAFCGQRNNEFDIYVVPAEGGEERRLTTAKGLDDGPDYSADGKRIYFNSERTGRMQVWRMNADGSDQEKVTSDELNNWFPHPSPDGKWLAFLSFEPDVVGHPANQPVRLRLMPLAGGPIQELARLFGGQGTINVSSWSPDSKQLAFVSYELIPR